MGYSKKMGERHICGKASFTVEATFVMLVSIWVILMLIYGTMYIHDSVVMKSVLRLRLQQGNLEQRAVKTDMQDKLFLIQCDDIKYSKGILSDKATLSYHLKITGKWIEKIFMNNHKTGEICVEKEKGNGAVLMWDATVIGDD